MIDNQDTEIENLVSKLLNKRFDVNKKNSHYWYPLNYATYGVEEIVSCLESLIAQRTSMSTKCFDFERLFKNYVNTKEAIYVNSGSSADLLAMNIMVKSPEYSLRRGDKVLVPAITWPTQVWSVIQAGLVPVLYDCSKTTFNPDINSVPRDILKECKMIFTTHILGTCCDMDELRNIAQENNLLIAEDSCESLGTLYKKQQVGTFGEVGTFSFFFSHHITTMEGGMICTKNEDLKNQAKIMRAHGWSRAIETNELNKFCLNRKIYLDQFKNIDKRYLFIDEGFNLRPTELNASFGIHQIKKINLFNEKRNFLSTKFYENISKLNFISGPNIVEGCEPCFMSLPVTINSDKFNASAAIDFLEKKGVESRPLIAGNLSKHPVNKLIKMELVSNKLSGADHHHQKSFYVGLSPVHTLEDIEKLNKIFIELDSSFQ